MPAPRELPIYELESRLVAALRAQGRLIVQAPTDSGKATQAPRRGSTTHCPRALKRIDLSGGSRGFLNRASPHNSFVA